MVLLMSVALTVFIVPGHRRRASPANFQQPGWITGGVMGVLMGTALMPGMRLAALTASLTSARKPKIRTKDIPFVIIVSTLLVTLVYILVGFVAAGVLPLEQVGGQPLTAVATAIMPTWLLYFFVICGARLRSDDHAERYAFLGDQTAAASDHRRMVPQMAGRRQ